MIHRSIYRAVEGKGKGFIAWLIDGRLTVDTDVLAELLNPAFTMSECACVVTPSSPRGVAQGQTNLLLHSFNRRRLMEQSPERKLGYGLENANLQQQRFSLPAATPSYKTIQNRVTGKLVLKSQLRYGNISFESADVEFLSQEFREIPEDIVQYLLKSYKHVQERRVKIMLVPSHTQHLVYIGDQEIEMADNDLLLLKTRVVNGLVSFHEDDVEARYPADWLLPVYILDSLRKNRSNGKLFIISDEKGNLRSLVKSAIKDRVAGTKDKALAFFTSK